MQTDKETGVSDGLKAVRSYPNNSLKEPVREFESVVFNAMREHFTK